jgi:hypothetical protein
MYITLGCRLPVCMVSRENRCVTMYTIPLSKYTALSFDLIFMKIGEKT